MRLGDALLRHEMTYSWRATAFIGAILGAVGAATAQPGIGRYKCADEVTYARLEAALAESAALYEVVLQDAIASKVCRLLPAQSRHYADMLDDDVFPPPRGIFRPKR
jgi:hypothetical protein